MELKEEKPLHFDSHLHERRPFEVVVLYSSSGYSRCYLSSRWKAFKCFWFLESLVKVDLVVHHLLVGQKVQPAFSTAMYAFSLL